MRRSYLIPLLLAALLCGCTQEAAANSTVSHSDTATSSANTDIFSARDLEIGYDADTADQTENTLAATGTFEALDGNNIDAAVFSTADLTLNGAGSLTVTSTDHGVVTKDDLTITGGQLIIDAGGDGLDSNGSFSMSGGVVFVSGSVSGADAPLDYETDGVITGGAFLGTGMQGMFVSFSEGSTQGAAALTVGSQSAGTTVTLTDSEGLTLLSWTAPKDFDTALLSCDALAVGASYCVTCGDSESTVTLDRLLYSDISSSFFGGRGQRP